MADIEIKYRCCCMVDEVPVMVPERADDQDVVDWVQQNVGYATFLDHRRRSPKCRSEKTDYVKIPAPENAPMLGQAPKLDS